MPHRTHSLTLTGEWSCRFGELQGRHYDTNSQAQFFIVAYPLEGSHPYESERLGITTRKKKKHRDDNSSSSSTRSSNSKKAGAVSNGTEPPCWLSDGGRIVWASLPICQRHYQQSNSNSSWVKLSVTFSPRKDEEYFLCIQPGPGASSQPQWW